MARDDEFYIRFIFDEILNVTLWNKIQRRRIH